jgi:hypothetical protein
VIQRHVTVERAAPLLVSSVSGLYIMARARRLATDQATEAPLLRFLLGQSDVILMLCGSPAVWYVAQRRRLEKRQPGTSEFVRGSTARAVHQLRQVFTALLLGTELLARKASAGKTGEIGKLARRLNNVVRDGLDALSALGEPYPSDLVDEGGAPLSGDLRTNGTVE